MVQATHYIEQFISINHPLKSLNSGPLPIKDMDRNTSLTKNSNGITTICVFKVKYKSNPPAFIASHDNGLQATIIEPITTN